MGQNDSYEHHPIQSSLRDFLLLINLVGFCVFSIYIKFKDDKSKQYYFRLLRLQLFESLSVPWIGLMAQQLNFLLLPLPSEFQQINAHMKETRVEVFVNFHKYLRNFIRIFETYFFKYLRPIAIIFLTTG